MVIIDSKKKTKVLFLIPTFRSKARYHPGIANLSAVLKSNGYKTDLIELNSLDFIFIRDYIEKCSPDVIAVSTNSHQYYYAKRIISFIRGNFKIIKIVLGGVHPTLDDNVVNEIREVDAVCRGEGEIPLLQYISDLEKEKTNYDIPNFTFRINNDIVENKISYYVKDLDSLPYPDYSIFPLFKKARKLTFPMRFLFNRGCPFNCTYCCNHKFKDLFPQKKDYVRYKSPQRVINEILYFSGIYDFDHYIVDDDIFTLNKKWLLEFCNLYPERLKKKTFTINVRVGTADKEMFKALKDIGCSLVEVGLESGSEDLRKQILGRNISQKEIIETANLAKSVSLKLHTFNMIGIPNETRRDVWKTIRLNRIIEPDETQLTVFYPYKNTLLGDYCYSKGLVKKERADTYFTDSILKFNFLSLSRLEVKHFISFFKFYIYIGKDHYKARKEFIKGVKSYLSRLKYFLIKSFEKINKVCKKLYKLNAYKYSTKNWELKYWKKAGIKKGNSFYRKYLDKFCIEDNFFQDKIVGDFGCGPFGGILSVIKGYAAGYPIDILASEYNHWGYSTFKINKFNGKRSNLQTGIIDVIFCCNTIDHTRYPQYIVNEMRRLLKINGVLFLHVHLRKSKELNEAHPLCWDEEIFRNIFKGSFNIEWCRIENLDDINGEIYKTLYAKLTKN